MAIARYHIQIQLGPRQKAVLLGNVVAMLQLHRAPLWVARLGGRLARVPIRHRSSRPSPPALSSPAAASSYSATANASAVPPPPAPPEPRRPPPLQLPVERELEQAGGGAAGAKGAQNGGAAGSDDDGQYETPQPPLTIFFTRRYWQEMWAFFGGMPNPPDYKPFLWRKVTWRQHWQAWKLTFQMYSETWKDVLSEWKMRRGGDGGGGGGVGWGG
jgi:hypothetical protein